MARITFRQSDGISIKLLLQVKRSNADLFTIRTNVLSFSYETCIKYADIIVRAIHPNNLGWQHFLEYIT